MITKRPGPNGKVRVTFAMPAAVWADTIYVVGDFNDWDERATPLRQTERGWMATLELEPGKAYQYRYLFDGSEWHNDWQADRYEPNAYGGDNSVVLTPDFGGTDHQAERVLSFSAPRLRLVPTG
jgi:1,4-alpha-glucan branching enzyme